MKSTKIEWCDCTVNPVVGCTFGCPYCYARKMNDRFHFVPDFSKPQFFPERLKQLDSKTPKIVFVDSMSDVADWDQATSWAIIDAQNENPQHVYLHLSKRPHDIKTIISFPNFWYGTSITCSSDMHRLADLRFHCDDAHTFVSIEPLHGQINLVSLEMWELPQWIIIGAETGNRPGKVVPDPDWVYDIIHDATCMGIPVFMKNSLVPIVGEKNMLREFPESILKWVGRVEVGK